MIAYHPQSVKYLVCDGMSSALSKVSCDRVSSSVSKISCDRIGPSGA